MRRIDIITGTKEVAEALNVSNIRKVFDEMRTARTHSKEGVQNVDLISALHEFSLKASRFSPAASEIADLLDLNSLTVPARWAEIMAGETSFIRMYFDTFRFAFEYLPKIIALLHQKGEEEFEGSPQRSKIQGEVARISVIILEEDAQFSKPQRLIEVLEATLLLYENCARLSDESPDTFAVVSCDSGSDKSFDFLGVAKIVEQVKEIVIALWDKVVFHKEKSFVAQTEAVTQGLAVFEKLTELEATNKIGREEAEIVRRGLIDGCKKFLSAGAIIPEIRAHAYHEPRVLMAPEQKLLMAPTDGDAPTPSGAVTGGDDEEEVITPEIWEQFQKFTEFKRQKEEIKGVAPAASSAEGIKRRTTRRSPRKPPEQNPGTP